MEVQVLDVGPCKKCLKIQVPAETVAEKINKSIEELVDTLALPGFRKGHVPRRLIEKRYGEQVQTEVKQEMLTESFEEAVKERSLDPIGEPKFDNVEFDPKNPLKFDVTFEVKPTFEIADYKGLRLVRKSSQVTDKDVDDTIESLRERRAVLSVVEGATVEANDVIICNAEATVGAEAAWKDENVEVPVAANAVGPVSVPELSRSLQGAKTGETREIPVKLGPTFPKEEHRGKDAVLKVALSEIKRPVKAEVNDDLAKQFGFDTLADLKTNLRRRIEVDKTAAVQRALEEQVKDRLLQKVDFELPADMLAREADRVLHRVQLRLQYRGVPWEEIEKNVEDLKKSSQEHAQREFKTYFILQEIADKEKIYATESEIEARVALMAQNYGVPAVKMHRRLESDGSLDELRVQMREDKTVAFLLEKAEIEDEAAPQKS